MSDIWWMLLVSWFGVNVGPYLPRYVPGFTVFTSVFFSLFFWKPCTGDRCKRVEFTGSQLTLAASKRRGARMT